MQSIDGIVFSKMVSVGAASLKAHKNEINDLNVFPIPDGDTGDNMLLTMMGGVCSDKLSSISDAAERVSSGMLMSARGNSGVILSQFFEGIKDGLSGLEYANTAEMANAFLCGVRQAYASVMTPTEGTILTVVREASEYAASQNYECAEDFLKAFIDEAKRSLGRTPELLPVLKQAGVVDSGGAGLIYIIDGMLRALLGEEISLENDVIAENNEPDLDAFGENDVLEFGYCTELLLRLQSSKTNVCDFDTAIITDYLKTVGDSIVAVKSGSIVKLHVHTKTPDRVLSYCQRYGEFLKVKIENMSLQHNSTLTKEEGTKKPREKFGVVAVATGDGLKKMLRDRGADVIVDGGQSMNPSTEDFINAFKEANADVIFVYPNNSNVILSAKQAAELYADSDVRVIESSTLGEGYASLAMLDTSSGDADLIESSLRDAMEDVVTAHISRCVRDASMSGEKIHTGDYIGFIGKRVLSVNHERFDTVCGTLDAMELKKYEFCILICGADATDEEVECIERHFKSHYKGKELYVVNGGQEIYDYIIIAE